MEDPVSILSGAYPYDPEKILATACGQAYVAIMLSNGNTGVCSTLGKPFTTDPLLLSRPDLNNHDHRILAIAYANANLNYLPANLGSGDIFDQVDFSRKTNTVMIGYFPPLVEKFRKDEIPLTVFDQQKDLPDLTPLNEMSKKAGEADCIIITATTLINGTFPEIIKTVNPSAGIFMLGPSTPLYPVIKEKYHLTTLFGMVFKPYDFELLSLIGQDLGTQSFSKRSKKVSL